MFCESPLQKIPGRRFFLFSAVLTGLVGGWTPALAADPAGEAPYVDSKAIKERFEKITAEDMDLLRQKKVLLVSRSFGLNLFKGLTQLAREDKKYDLLSSYQQFDVNKAGGGCSASCRNSPIFSGPVCWIMSGC